MSLPEFDRLLTFSMDSVRIWDLNSNVELLALTGPGHSSLSTQQIGDEKMLFSLHKNSGFLEVWEPAPWLEISAATDPKEQFRLHKIEELGRSSQTLLMESQPVVWAVTTQQKLIEALTQLRDNAQKEKSERETLEDYEGLLLDGESEIRSMHAISLQKHDQIITVNSERLDSEATVVRQLNSLIDTFNGPSNATVELDIVRNEVEHKISYILEEIHEEKRSISLSRDEAADIFAGFEQSLRNSPDLNSATNGKVNGDGFVIPRFSEVEDHRRAVRNQVYSNDRILALNGEIVSDSKAFIESIADLATSIANGDTSQVTFDVLRGEFQKIHFIYHIP
jgi:hypothetical protein